MGVCLILPYAYAPEVAATLWRRHGLETFTDPQTFGGFTKEKGIFSGANQHGPNQCGGSGQGGERFSAGKHFLAQILILRVLGICLQWLEAFILRRSTMRAGGTPSGHGFLRENITSH